MGEAMRMLVDRGEPSDSSSKGERDEPTLSERLEPPREPAALPPRCASWIFGGIVKIGLLVALSSLGVRVGRSLRRTAGVSGKAPEEPEELSAPLHFNT